eukprot:scaffold11106_cov100-Skeletonema_dohrnii-CCMP3373.AAC.2
MSSCRARVIDKVVSVDIQYCIRGGSVPPKIISDKTDLAIGMLVPKKRQRREWHSSHFPKKFSQSTINNCPVFAAEKRGKQFIQHNTGIDSHGQLDYRLLACHCAGT